ncbi:nagb/rpia/CoA transferase-like protein [Xylona heveae TC161]|uniref:Translation initiation factor eIF2B subunit beta n=1 Tax=Xylona heveae (strain CBS 132557 / TC161) TaxID=1328760 RepID=A0A165J2U8_XYLHT|nr:nagb/rpia/CoA transferase-like protein [Xylona heveae TC161]KZF25653.1 nagb/rpia/CoA transferase-like protein [Xylona heveae TC161]
MPSPTIVASPGLSSFLKSLKSTPVEASIEHLISLLKRRQIRNSRPCAVATAQLLLRVVSAFRWTDVSRLIERIQLVGQRLQAAQPRELSIGNIVRRILGLVREEAEEDRDADASALSEPGTDSQPGTPRISGVRPPLSSSISTLSPLRHGAIEPLDPTVAEPDTAKFVADSAQRPPLLTSHTSYAASATAPMATSMFSLLSHPETPSSTATPSGTQSPSGRPTSATQAVFASLTQKDLRPEVIGGIEEIIDELDQVDEQIAGYALDHIHSNEIILTHTSSMTVQKFLLTAARKRKFTVVHAEAYPNDHEATHATVTGKMVNENQDELSSEAFQKPLTAAGITVILIPDSAVFALMSRVNKVILGTHAVLANGGLVAAAGTRAIAKAAKTHKTPVVVVSGVYKLSPVYPFDFESLIEFGDVSKVFSYEDGDLVEKVDVENPLFDYVPAELVDLYITNLGGHAPSYLYRIVADHYRVEDINI